MVTFNEDDMRLSQRLFSIAKMVDSCKTVADIGTDHALIPIYLIINKVCTRAIASDIGKGPIEKAITNINRYGLQDQIDTRVGPGLNTLPEGEAEVIIIAGMGGLLINQIIEQGSRVAEKVQSIILQPMTHHSRLREWLSRNGYCVIDEDLAEEDNKIYLILKVKPGCRQLLDSKSLYFGEILFEKKHPLLEKYIQKNISEMETVKLKLSNKDTERSKQKLREVNEKLELFKSMLREI